MTGNSDARARSSRLSLPETVKANGIFWPNVSWVILPHLIALLAFFPWFFSWTGVILCALGIYTFGLLGINLCYHRLLAHRAFKCPKWLEHSLAILGLCGMQDTPARWVAIHRRHHHHADEQSDPHSPLVNFFRGHMGWLLAENADLRRLRIFDAYAKDILRDPFYMKLERNFMQLKVFMACWLLFYLAGFSAALLLGSTLAESVQFGASVLVWGVFVRTVIVWHQTWAVNSVTHLWGYRTYETDERSRNNVFVGLLVHGEGWHNNHHAEPRSAKHGHHWWELDLTYLIIRLLARLDLARDVVMPTPLGELQQRAGRLNTRQNTSSPGELDRQLAGRTVA